MPIKLVTKVVFALSYFVHDYFGNIFLNKGEHLICLSALTNTKQFVWLSPINWGPCVLFFIVIEKLLSGSALHILALKVFSSKVHNLEIVFSLKEHIFNVKFFVIKFFFDNFVTVPICRRSPCKALSTF